MGPYYNIGLALVGQGFSQKMSTLAWFASNRNCHAAIKTHDYKVRHVGLCTKFQLHILITKQITGFYKHAIKERSEGLIDTRGRCVERFISLTRETLHVEILAAPRNQQKPNRFQNLGVSPICFLPRHGHFLLRLEMSFDQSLMGSLPYRENFQSNHSESNTISFGIIPLIICITNITKCILNCH